MKINLDKLAEQDIKLIEYFILSSKDWKIVDENVYERKFGERNVILVLYPELLRYGFVYRQGRSGDKVISEDHLVVWTACRIELEGDQNTEWHREILEELKEWVMKKIPFKPFKDEDATLGIYSKKSSPYSRDWTKYIFYINPDFKDGWWENHALN